MWCAHPRPRRGEIFSSWLTRCAQANGLSCHCFTDRTFGAREVWTRDIDRSAASHLLVTAAEVMGVPELRLRRTLIQHYAGILFEPTFRGGTLPWITPAGVYHRTRRRHGAAYCPYCLQEFGCVLLAWRIAWMVHCPRHEIPLRDACPFCDAPFVFHKIWSQGHDRYPCPACGGNLADTRRNMPPISMKARTLQRSLTASCVQNGRTVAGQRLTSLEFSSGLRFLLRGLYERKKLGGLATGGRKDAQIHPSIRRAPSPLAFEHWRIQQRAAAMSHLAVVLHGWPEAFLLAMKRGRVSRHRFGESPAPAWVAVVLEHRDRHGNDPG